MTGTRRDKLRLYDILEATAGIRETVGALSFEAFTTVWSAKRACERGIEIISEASRHIPDQLKQTEPAIPWRQIAGVGNILRHGYQTVSDRVIWDIIVTQLDPLEAAVRRLLQAIDAEDISE